MIWAVIWYYLLAVFTAADIITTKIALSVGMHEVNPFMAPLVDHIIEVKILFMLGMIVAVIIVEKTEKGSGWLPVAGSACVTCAAVTSNIIQISQVLL
jgi:hypothetical protein